MRKPIILKSPVGVLRTTYGDVQNGRPGTQVGNVDKLALVKFDELAVPVEVPLHWLEFTHGQDVKGPETQKAPQP